MVQPSKEGYFCCTYTCIAAKWICHISLIKHGDNAYEYSKLLCHFNMVSLFSVQPNVSKSKKQSGTKWGCMLEEAI